MEAGVLPKMEAQGQGSADWAGRVGADTKANTLGAAAHSRLEIFVSLRTAASADAPWALMSLLWRLQARGGARMVREQAFMMSAGADTKASTMV